MADADPSTIGPIASILLLIPWIVTGAGYGAPMLFGSDITFTFVYTVAGMVLFGVTIAANLALRIERPAARADATWYALPDVGYVNTVYLLATYLVMARLARTRIGLFGQFTFAALIIAYSLVLDILEFLSWPDLLLNLGFALSVSAFVAVLGARIVRWIAFIGAESPWARKHGYTNLIFEPLVEPEEILQGF